MSSSVESHPVRFRRLEAVPPLVAFAALVLSACTPAAPGPTSPPASPAAAKSAATGPLAGQELYEAAKKEGKVVWYTAMTQTDAQAVLNAFTKKYPGIETELWRASGEEVLQRATAEAKAGKFLVDINSSDGMREMIQEKLLETYESPERAAIPAELQDKQGYWTTVSLLAFVPAYNTNNVKAADAPKTYADLGDPKWKGRISVEEDAWDWMGALFMAEGEQKVVATLEKWSANQPKRIKGWATQVEQMVIGEVDAGMAHLHSVLAQKKKSAPVDWTVFEPAIVRGHNLALHANAPHPNAGKLLINFILSGEGQKLIGDRGRNPARPGMPNALDQLIPKDTKVFYSIDVSLPKSQTELSKQWRGIFFK